VVSVCGGIREAWTNFKHEKKNPILKYIYLKMGVSIVSSHRVWGLYGHWRPMFFSNYGPKSGGGGKSLLFLLACWSNIFPNTCASLYCRIAGGRFSPIAFSI